MENFREKMLEVRPEIAEREAEFPVKIDLAMELGVLRDAANLSQEEIASLAELPLGGVQACEALTGEMPVPDLVAEYRSAVAAHVVGCMLRS